MKAILITFLLTLVISLQAQDQNSYEVYAIEYASAARRAPVKTIALNATSNDSVTFSFYVWYLKGENGRRILIDTGFLPDSSRRMMPLKEYVRPDLALQRIHVNADEITDVIITHPHSDHIGGLGLFTRGTLWMQKNDYTYFVGDAWQKGANHAGLDKGDVLKTVQANLEGRLHLVDGDSVEIIPGIRVFTGSKHTFESQHVLVTTKLEKVLLASDDAWFCYNIDNLVPITLTFNPDAYAKGLRRMKTLVSNPDLIIPGHDSLVLSRFTRVADGIVRIR
jgi:glyoxylase-like metal-dependent hydrolase (beta-lactamase superfamily II)